MLMCGLEDLWMRGLKDLVYVKSVIMKIREPKLIQSNTNYFLNSPL